MTGAHVGPSIIRNRLEKQREYLRMVAASEADFSSKELDDESMIWRITRIPDPTPKPLKAGTYHIRNVRNGDINVQGLPGSNEYDVVSSSEAAVVRGVSYLP
jgi:hypothetical protein